MVTLTPLRRLQNVANFDDTAERLVSQAFSEYSWFLQSVGHPEPELLEWIKNAKNRDEAFDHARRFGQKIFDLVLHLANGKPFLRYMVV